MWPKSLLPHKTFALARTSLLNRRNAKARLSHRGVIRTMITRRALIRNTVTAASLFAIPAVWSAADLAGQKLPRRPIPGTSDSLPVIGLGNSNAFRQNDVPGSTALIKLFHEYGGAYIDCGGDSRFVVAEVARSLKISDDLFLGAYFSGDGEPAMRENIKRMMEISGKKQLDLTHSYPEFAEPNWGMFQKWKDEGLTKYIGVARHRESYYQTMMEMMNTGTVDFLQVNYSPLETAADQKVLPMALDKGVAVTINRPFINGDFFSLVRGHPLPDWAAEFDCESWAQFSLKFILSNPAVTCVLTETANPKHALDNIGAGFGRLPDEKTRKRMVQHLKNL
jgi:diketogulonate reductase-like aldo/keto reductase